MRKAILAGVVCGLSLLLLGCEPEVPPPVFTRVTLAEAKAQVSGTPKLLIVKATAAWCPPCKKMNKGTWRDARVEGWVAENGIAIEVDVDQKPEEARAMRITAMPTMVVFKDGEEFDRTVGYMDADQLLAWLNAVKAGERAGLKGRGTGT